QQLGKCAAAPQGHPAGLEGTSVTRATRGGPDLGEVVCHRGRDLRRTYGGGGGVIEVDHKSRGCAVADLPELAVGGVRPMPERVREVELNGVWAKVLRGMTDRVAGR